MCVSGLNHRGRADAVVVDFKGHPLPGELAVGILAGKDVVLVAHPRLFGGLVADQRIEKFRAAQHGATVGNVTFERLFHRAQGLFDDEAKVARAAKLHGGFRLGNAELAEQVIDDGGAVGIDNLAFDRAQHQVFDGGVVAVAVFGNFVSDDFGVGEQRVCRPRLAHVLDLVGADGRLQREVRHAEGADDAVLAEGFLVRCIGTVARRDEGDTAADKLDHDGRRGQVLFAPHRISEQAGRDVGLLGDGLVQFFLGETKHG